MTETLSPPNAARPVVDTSHSPHAKMCAVSPESVRLTDSFWEPRMARNRDHTLFSQFQQMEETGRIDNFRRASGKKPDLPFQGIYYNDSDVYKWLEGAVWSLGTHPNPELQKIVETAVTEISDAQQPNGYLNTYFMCDLAGERWSNIKDKHEMYMAGHFIQAAVAHKRALGNDDLLRVAIRLADHILDTFGPEKRPGACGHQEIEMAMVELYRETGDERYLRQAEFFIDVRGRKPPVLGGAEYVQDHAPFISLDENVGHAVRMLYMNAGVADIVLETGDAKLLTALDRLWDDFTQRKMYITGGAGARWEGEAFGAPYQLPNTRAYAETCAAIAVAMWGARMLALTADAKYADVMERALYNGVMSGLSLDGDHYFYQNPLADRGAHRREAWFGCACCPPNLARVLAELPGYFHSTSEKGIYTHLYAEGEAVIGVGDNAVTLTTHTRYPWNGDVEIAVSPERPGEFSLFLRIPEWCEGAALSVNGEAFNTPIQPGSYAEVRREWKAGDTVRLSLPMEVRAWQAHPHVEADTNKVAITRGPLVYCLEAADNAGLDVWDAEIAADADWKPQDNAELLNGIVTLTTGARLEDLDGWGGALYRPAGAETPTRAATVTAIPYYAWANREPGPMTVWVKMAR